MLRLLFHPDGSVSSRTFLRLGAGLFLLKYLLDATMVWLLFEQTWLPWDYLNWRWRALDLEKGENLVFACVMLALALPFIWAGVVLTIKRLRSADWPRVMAWLFFVPYLNILFFLVLIWAPERPHSGTNSPHSNPSKPLLSRSFRNGVFVWLSVVILSVGLIAFSVSVNTYGFGLFVGLPFVIGFIPGLFYRPDEESSLASCFQMVLMIYGVTAVTLLVFAMEGLICMAMAAPIALFLSGLGTVIGYWIRTHSAEWSRRQPVIFCSAFALLPIVVLGEVRLDLQPRLIAVRTAIKVEAPPETVWENVIAFPELPPPTELMFKAGIAYPIRAQIQGNGPGALRFCMFSTGSFVEPIEIWEEPSLLRFSVTSNPPPMQELSFYEIDPPHLHGFLRSEAEQFKLTRLPSGATLLEGTTWYRHNLWPEGYWQLWSDYIIHTIHLRVLTHIRDISEHQSGERQSQK